MPALPKLKESVDLSYLKLHPIAYFCAEFALINNLSTYAGGLGVLAADVVRECAASGFPLFGVGLFYKDGYKAPNHVFPETDKVKNSINPKELELIPVKGIDGKNILIDLLISDKAVFVKAWKWTQNNVDVFLLDTNVEENSPQDRNITASLYSKDKETRIKQMMVLGIGGVKFLNKLGITPSVYHVNEGHSAFLAFELARMNMEKSGGNFHEALEQTKKQFVFTNHTLVPAGQEVVSNDLVFALFSQYAQSLGIPVTDLVAPGLVQDSSLFSMTMLALRLAGKTNAVSQLHAQKAAFIWTDHPMVSITNGINISFWDSIGEGSLWEKHQENKQHLVSFVNRVGEKKWDRDTLFVGWARRIVSYKRPLAILENLDRLLSQASGSQPIKIIFSGLAHDGDNEGENILEQLKNIIREKLDDIAIFLPDYDLELAHLLVSGCDVWLNTPIVGFEACGTSSMKAALNGCLPISTNDGWIAEVDISEFGWLVDDNHLNEDLLNTLKRQVAPLYYSPQKTAWITRMQNAREQIIKNFSTARLLCDYTEKLYLPTIKAGLTG